MIFVQTLSLVDAPVQARREVLCKADEGLKDEEDVCDQTQNCVWRLEMSAVVIKLVVLDDDETGYRSQQGYIVEGCVGVCSLLLLLGRVCWLNDQNALNEEEEGGGVEELGIVSTNS